jgi:hypothetical protein
MIHSSPKRVNMKCCTICNINSDKTLLYKDTLEATVIVFGQIWKQTCP